MSVPGGVSLISDIESRLAATPWSLTWLGVAAAGLWSCALVALYLITANSIQHSIVETAVSEARSLAALEEVNIYKEMLSKEVSHAPWEAGIARDESHPDASVQVGHEMLSTVVGIGILTHDGPSSWERDALRALSVGAGEHAMVATMDGRRFVRLMRPLRSQHGCFSCHPGQARTGDLMGGIAVNVPLAPIQDAMSTHHRTLTIGFSAIWLAGALMIAVGHTRLKKKTLALYRAGKVLNRMMDSALDAIILIDNSGHVAYWNPAAEKIFGYSKAEAIGVNLHGLVAPEGLKTLRTQGSGGDGAEFVGSTIELVAVGKSRKAFPVELSLSGGIELDGHRHVLGIVRDITERKHAEAEMHKARAEAERASRAKSEFLSTMSHEIRTPLNAIIGAASLSLQSDIDGEHREHFEIVQDAAEGLLQIINEILDLARIESGRIDLTRRAVNLHRLVQGTVRYFRIVALRKGLRVEAVVGDDVPAFIAGDEGRLRQVLLNLIGNAVKFTENGSVKVSVSAERAHAASGNLMRFTFRVADTGCGIPRHEQQAIFESFHQVSAPSSSQREGAGLGLAISKGLVTAMGGGISVESVQGEGSTFSFDIIAEPAVEPERSAIDVHAPSHGQDATLKMKILIAEDNLVNQKIIARILERSGHSIRIVGNGAQALSAVRQERFDCILMDVKMPVMDGLEATRALKAGVAPASASIPVIGITASTTTEDVARCYDAGMDGFVPKPVSAVSLINGINLSLAKLGWTR